MSAARDALNLLLDQDGDYHDGIDCDIRVEAAGEASEEASAWVTLTSASTGQERRFYVTFTTEGKINE